MASVINVGVVGCGYWGPNLARNFDALPGCRLKAVCDSDAERLRHMRSLYPEVEIHVDYDQFLRDSSLDAVVIATGARHHHPMGKASLMTGRNTFIEKPIATSSAECEELIRIAHERQLVLMAGHTYRYSPVVRRIKEIVDSGELGEIRYISAQRLNLGVFQRDINVTWDLAPHDLSIILYLMGEAPLSVNCQGSANVSPWIHDITNMWLAFPKNRSATIRSSWLDPRKSREMTIVGSKKMIIYDDLANREKIRIYDVRVESPPHYDNFADFHYNYHHGDVVIPYVNQEEPLKVECQHFLDCIRDGTEPLTHGGQALQVIQILEAASRSLEQDGAAVALAADPVSQRGQPGAAGGSERNGTTASNHRPGKNPALLRP